MRLLFLNQYAPPDRSPTARLLGELAEFLRTRGHVVKILSQQESYGGRPARGGGRLRRELAALWQILRTGWQHRDPRPDVVLALSSPPGLAVMGALLAFRHRARFAHWAMDLYPELAVALGESSARRLDGLIRAAMHWAYRRAALVVALDEDMRAHLQPFCRSTVQIMEPWPAINVEKQIDAAVASSDAPDAGGAGPWTWLYSGNLGRAHEWQTLLDAQGLLQARGLPVRLVFQGDGSSRALAEAYATKLGLRGCEWKDYVPEEDLLPSLLQAQVLIVTQRPETRGLLWPSKLALLERLPRPILFAGPIDGAIAGRLRRRANVGLFTTGDAQGVADWIEEQHRAPAVWSVPSRPTTSFLPAVEGCDQLERWLSDLR